MWCIVVYGGLHGVILCVVLLLLCVVIQCFVVVDVDVDTVLCCIMHGLI